MDHCFMTFYYFHPPQQHGLPSQYETTLFLYMHDANEKQYWLEKEYNAAMLSNQSQFLFLYNSIHQVSTFCINNLKAIKITRVICSCPTKGFLNSVRTI